MNYFTNNIDQDQLNVISETFFKGNPVSLKDDLEGQAIENNNFVLGCQAGPVSSVEYLLHEMAHLAELDKNRLIQKPNFGWGFGWGQYWEVGRASGYEPTTDKSLRREIRAWAYQISIMRKFNIGNLDLIELVNSATHVDSFFIYKCNALSREIRTQLGYKEADEETIKIIAKEVDVLSNTDYCFDKFNKSWKERMEFLR